MNRLGIYFILLATTLLACSKSKDMTVKIKPSDIMYPNIEERPVTDVYFGHEVVDPFRWLEDDTSEDTKRWVNLENTATFDYLSKIPFRDQYKKRLEKLMDYEKVSSPFKEGEYTYYYKNDGLQNQSVLWRTKDGEKPEIFLDPNKFSVDGTTSLAGISFSKDGSRAAYQVSEGGSDWRKVIILDTKTRKILEDTIIDVKFSGISWKGSEGFYYSSYDKPEGSELSAMTDHHKLYYHQLGTPQSEDQVIFGQDLKRRYVGASVSEDSRYLYITAANATSGNELYLIDLLDSDQRRITIQNDMNSDTYVVANEGARLLLLTNRDAPNYQMVATFASHPTPNNWLKFIPETENVLSVTKGAGYIFAHYMKDALSSIKQYDYDGREIREIQLPGLGTASLYGAKKRDKDMYFVFTNYITPSTIYKLDPETGQSDIYVKPNIDFKPEKYVSEQVFYTSKDGTKVPMMITYKKGLKMNGKNPTMLYGYGGFNISLTPSFSVLNAAWIEQGGIYAVPNLRGGGEYGKEWHDAGTQMRKQNVFDDFIAAAEYLIAQNYTSSNYLAISGGSNGGLLVGACMTQRPELFKVALPAVGVLDMLRYHTFTAGAGWAYDYGTSEQSKDMFLYLKGYSPVHNVKAGVSYPATLVTTADHDDRVVPAHSFKFISELQKKNKGNNPVLIRIEKSAGHGAGKPTSKIIEEATDRYCFALFNMGRKFVKP